MFSVLIKEHGGPMMDVKNCMCCYYWQKYFPVLEMFYHTLIKLILIYVYVSNKMKFKEL